jgi:hypothetical protein
MSYLAFSLACYFACSTGIPVVAISLDESPGGHCPDPDFYSLHLVSRQREATDKIGRLVASISSICKLHFGNAWRPHRFF